MARVGLGIHRTPFEPCPPLAIGFLNCGGAPSIIGEKSGSHAHCRVGNGRAISCRTTI